MKVHAPRIAAARPLTLYGVEGSIDLSTSG